MTDNLKHKIIKYLNSEYGNLTPFETKKYPNRIFFMKDVEVIFDYNKKNGYVHVSYDKIWLFLQNFFGLEYEEIQDLTKEWVEEHYKLGTTTTKPLAVILTKQVEEHYKLGTTTTSWKNVYPALLVEEHYKLRVTTTKRCRYLHPKQWSDITN